jgi:TatD-related deoxyribonuclease
MSEDFGMPVLDNHLHLDPVHGRGVEAAKDFARAGGTHLLVLNKPSWMLVGEVTGEAGFRETFDLTVEAAREASDVLRGVHPALISKLVERGYSPEEVAALMKTGLDVAAEFVAEGPALALKSGRPHYDVSDEVWAASNDVMRHAFALGAETGCAVQLHTEGGEDFVEVAEWAEAEGLPRERVVKHYATGGVEGPVPSVLARHDELVRAADREIPFFMETHYIDDPDRPGAVLGPKTVPRRTATLLESGYEAAMRRAHVETPARVYGIDTEATLE